MNANKKRLIHTLFRLASITGQKVHMSLKDYQNFYKACDLKKIDLPGNGADYTKDLVITDYREACAASALCLDYSSTYGGYNIEQLSPSTGVDHPFGPERHNASTLAQLLRMFSKGYSQGIVSGLRRGVGVV
jgi:hypothetical protein